MVFNSINGLQELKSGIYLDVKLKQKDSKWANTVFPRAHWCLPKYLCTTHFPGASVLPSISFSYYAARNWRKFNIVLLFIDSKNTVLLKYF